MHNKAKPGQMKTPKSAIAVMLFFAIIGCQQQPKETPSETGTLETPEYFGGLPYYKKT
jgi:hypothetical protein